MSNRKTKKLSTEDFIKAWIDCQDIKDWDAFAKGMIKKHEAKVLASELPTEKAINMRCAKINSRLRKLTPKRSIIKPDRPKKPQKNIATLFSDNIAVWSKEIPIYIEPETTS